MAFPAHWPVVGICGYSGSGKTTLVESLIPRLRAQGLTVAVIKHDAHGMILDKPGKDTDRFFRAGPRRLATTRRRPFCAATWKWTRCSPGRSRNCCRTTT